MESQQPNLPRSLLTAVTELARALDEQGVSYALIGGLAAGYRSQPRFTQDVALLLRIPQLSLPGLLDRLRDKGFEFDATTVIREWTQEHMTMLTCSGVRVDWLKPVLPCFQHVIDTAQEESWLGLTVRIASAEALILMKLISLRQQDLVDIENLLIANRGALDREWIRAELATVTSADDPRRDKLREMTEVFYLESGTHPREPPQEDS